MNRRLALRHIAMTGAGLCITRQSFSFQPDESTFHSEVRLVLLDASVKDPKGGFVTGLTRENFSITEDGRPQTITVFDSNDMPVTVGLIVDESRSMTPKRGDVLVAAEVFIMESNPQDEVFVLNFNDSVKPGLPADSPFSADLKELSAALYRGVPAGRTALNDAIVDGLGYLESGGRQKKTLVVISDGGDNASRHTRREMLDLVEQSAATIYTIGLFDDEDADRNPGILREVARISGGEAYFPPKPEEMIHVCRRIAQDIRTRYTLGYHPDRGKHPGVRHIEVRASAPGHPHLKIRTRSSYRYEQIEAKK